MELTKLLTDYLVPFCAIAAFALSLYNLYIGLHDRRVNLTVKPMRTMAFGQPDGISIEVINNSKFPVSVAEIGLTLDGDTIENGRGAFTLSNNEFPNRLEAGEACRGDVTTLKLKDHWQKLGRAYAQTSCGRYAYGNSDALKQMKAQLRTGDVPQTASLKAHSIGPGEFARTANRV